VIVVTSKRTGLGKSQYIVDRVSSVYGIKYDRIPIYGDANRTKLAEQHI